MESVLLPTMVIEVKDNRKLSVLIDWIVELKDLTNGAPARHEALDRRIKSFFILSTTFCGTKDKKEKHKVLFEAVCILREYENGHPL